LEIKAYAKINLTLEVLGRRPDGYHEVKTILQTIDLADRLLFAPAPRLELVLRLTEGIEVSTPGLDGKDNLVWKAADTLRRVSECDKGVKILLEKHIPIGMGLGGGSSDAAATLKALVKLWELDMSDAELRSIAASLGSDVPFFLRGGTALGEGRGEVIVDLPPMPPRWIVLLCPLAQGSGSGAPLTKETPKVGRGEGRREAYEDSRKTARLYSMLSPEHYTDGSYTRRLVNTLKGANLAEAGPKASLVSQELLFNTFERVAPLAFHGFQRARQSFLEAGAQRVHLSGTGPALYTFVPSREDGEEILSPLKRMGLRAYCISTVQPMAESGVDR